MLIVRVEFFKKFKETRMKLFRVPVSRQLF